MDAFPTIPILPVEDSRSAAPAHAPLPATVTAFGHAPGTIGTGHITCPVAGFSELERVPGPEAPVAGACGGDRDTLAAAVNILVGMPLDKVERLVIEANIHAFGGSLPKAARSLGVSPSTLYRKRAGWIDPLPDP